MSTDPSPKPARPYRGQSPEQRRAERREKLVQAGIEVFGGQGFHAATVKQICAAAGLTERYFYESFENLQALFSAAYDHELDRLRAAILHALATAPRMIEPRKIKPIAQSALRAYFGTLQREPLMARILLIEVYGTTHEIDRLYRRGVHDFAELIRGIFETQLRLPKDAELNAGLLSTALVGAAIHLGMRWYLSGYRESLDTMVANTLAIVMAVANALGRASVTQPSK